jgi:hypothetical protein
MQVIALVLVALLAVGSNAQLETCGGCLDTMSVLADHSATEEGIAVSEDFIYKNLLMPISFFNACDMQFLFLILFTFLSTL